MKGLQEVEKFWAKVCFDPQYQPEGRFKTYRELVVQGMLDVLESMCPIANHILSEGEWREIFWHFLKKSRPQSAILRTLPYEVAQFLQEDPSLIREKYPYLGELMEYEYLEVQVRFAPEEELKISPSKLYLNPAHVLRHYRWPVHFISESHHNPADLPQGDYYLFIWRDPKNWEVKFMEVNPLVASLLKSLKARAPSESEALKEVAREMGIEFGSEYLQEGQALIKGLYSQGILLK